MAVIRFGSSEILCEVCEAIASNDTSSMGEPVINRGDVCVDLSGQPGEASRLSALRPELACLPKMRLCPDHLRAQRRKDGGEWVTITDASAMFTRRDKKEMESLPPLVQDGGGGSKLVSRLMENLGGTASDSSSPYLILRKQIKK